VKFFSPSLYNFIFHYEIISTFVLFSLAGGIWLLHFTYSARHHKMTHLATQQNQNSIAVSENKQAKALPNTSQSRTCAI
jgi:hypothetical protein